LTDDLLNVLKVAAKFAIARGAVFPAGLLEDLAKHGFIKTYAFYASSIRDLTKKMYDGKITYSDFVTGMENLIVQELRNAWFEGMAENGLTEEDMTPEWADMLREIIMSEQDHVADFALAIEQAKRADEPLEPLMSRADLWGNRFPDVVNQAKIATAEVGDKYEWVYSPEKEHCPECEALNGIVAYASEWYELGVKPQSPPNSALTCSGWNCGCRLDPTTKRRTRNAVERITSITGTG
jgi:hypothetical protein